MQQYDTKYLTTSSPSLNVQFLILSFISAWNERKEHKWQASIFQKLIILLHVIADSNIYGIGYFKICNVASNESKLQISRFILHHCTQKNCGKLWLQLECKLRTSCSLFATWGCTYSSDNTLYSNRPAILLKICTAYLHYIRNPNQQQFSFYIIYFSQTSNV